MFSATQVLQSKVDTLHIQMMEENVKPQHLFQGNAE